MRSQQKPTFGTSKPSFPNRIKTKHQHSLNRDGLAIRVAGIEPALHAWEARVLPLNDTRANGESIARKREDVKHKRLARKQILRMLYNVGHIHTEIMQHLVARSRESETVNADDIALWTNVAIPEVRFTGLHR